MKKYQPNPKRGTGYKTTGQCPPRISASTRTKKGWGTATKERYQNEYTTRSPLTLFWALLGQLNFKMDYGLDNSIDFF